MPAETAAPAAPAWRSWLGAAAVVILALWLHVLAAYTLPRPWPDESHFIAPALALLQDFTLAVPELNAPQGIFWMPAGYYVLQVPLLATGLDPLAAGRLLSLVGVVVFAVAVAAAVVRHGVPPSAAYGAAAVWICLPRVVAAANIARMEGPVLGCAGAALLAAAAQRWWVALAVGWAVPLIHPVGAVVAVAVTVSAIVAAPVRRPSRAEAVALALVVAAWAVQVGWFLQHADTAAAHLAFQFTRKAGRAMTPQWFHWVLLIVTAVGGTAATVRWWRRGDAAARTVWLLLALAGAFVLVDVVGREMWYELVGRETALLLVLLAAMAVLPATGRALPNGRLRVALVVVVVAATAVSVGRTGSGTWYGMRADPASRGEWEEFRQVAQRELVRLDGQAGPPATVVVDPLSGFGQEVFARPWRRLKFVQPTPVTPLEATTGDYILTTPGAPFVTRGLTDGWDAPAPVVEAQSPAGTYRLQVFADPGP